MTKRRTQAEQKADIFSAYKQMRAGESVKRKGARDGSIPTHPVVPVDPAKTEAAVLEDCIAWFKRHRIMADRHDCGSGNLGAGYATYGIKGAGDIIGLLRNGRHFEVECKKGAGGRFSKEQQKRMRDVRKNNGLYFVVHGVEELEYYMRDYI